MKNTKNLFRIKLFWIALLIPITTSLLIALYIINTSDLIYVSSFAGLNNAIGIFKVPLAVLALVFPSIAIVVANHRSQLTVKQIKETQLQNSFSNYFKHVEEFNIYILGIPDTGQKGASHMVRIILDDTRSVHNSIFSTMYNFTPEVPLELIDLIEVKSSKIYNEIKKLNNEPTLEEFLNANTSIHSDIEFIISTFSLNRSDYPLLESGTDSKGEPFKHYLSYGGIEFGVQMTFRSLRYILAFTGQNINLESFNKLCSLKRKIKFHRDDERTKFELINIDNAKHNHLGFEFNDFTPDQ